KIVDLPAWLSTFRQLEELDLKGIRLRHSAFPVLRMVVMNSKIRKLNLKASDYRLSGDMRKAFPDLEIKAY
ncbi:MAG: hypothetical protein AAF570_21590, partial [Bacteroidota bacterium]